MIRFIILLLIFATFQLKAQTPEELAAIDNKMLKIPHSHTQTTTIIANYINKNFSTQSEKVRAAFIWVASNIRYDIDNMFEKEKYQKKEEIIVNTLKSRKGVCRHYAEVFADITNKLGITTYVIPGYTKQNNEVDNISHFWCVAYLDSGWHLFDPTWGSGSISKNKFIRNINNYYYKTNPEKLIHSHMPFDPMWQLLIYPITNQEFYDGKFETGKDKPYFNFNDSIAAYEKLSKEEQLKASADRIEKNGLKNAMIKEMYQNLKTEIENIKTLEINNQYNEAVNFYNEAIRLYNVFINFKNRQFTPYKEDNEIIQMIADVELALNKSLNNLNEIKNPDTQTTRLMNKAFKNIDELIKKNNEQKDFVNKYCNTSKTTRKTLFYKR